MNRNNDKLDKVLSVLIGVLVSFISNEKEKINE